MAAELSLEALREEIDKIDDVIVRLLDRRARCAYAIGRLKHEQGLQIYEPAREASVMAHVRAVNSELGGPLDGDAVVRLYERIMDEARRIQRIESGRMPDGSLKAPDEAPALPEDEDG
jgi:chorismate mutase